MILYSSNMADRLLRNCARRYIHHLSCTLLWILTQDVSSVSLCNPKGFPCSCNTAACYLLDYSTMRIINRGAFLPQPICIETDGVWNKKLISNFSVIKVIHVKPFWRTVVKLALSSNEIAAQCQSNCLRSLSVVLGWDGQNFRVENLAKRYKKILLELSPGADLRKR